MKKKITKSDIENMADKFYEIHDHVSDVVREMMEIKLSVDEHKTDSKPSLNNFCIARHDKKIVVAYFYFGGNTEIQFPLSYLYDPKWKEEYRAKLVKEKADTAKSRENYAKQCDLEDIKRLKKLYPEEFK